MNTKKLIVFLLLAFLPMVIVGVVMRRCWSSRIHRPADHGYSPVSVRQVYQQGEGIYKRPITV